MRILSFLFSSAIFLVIFVVIGFFVGREALLWRAVTQLQSGISAMEHVSNGPGKYITDCQIKGSVIGGDPTAVISRLQIRFTSDTEYAVELLCDGFPLDPVQLSQGKLPPFVHKVPGSSGIVWSATHSGVELEIWGRKRDVYVEEFVSGSSMNGTGNVGTLTPESTCQGYGFMCCQNDTQAGKGTQYNQVSDCPRSCFTSCVNRPVVLSLTSDPFPNQATHTVTAKSGTTVIFSYDVSSDVPGKNVITMNYGDGKVANLDSMNGQTQHTYTCPSAQCRYTVQLGVIDAHGTPSVITGVSSLPLVITQ